MELLGLLFLVGLGFACKAGWDAAWEAARKSRAERLRVLGKEHPKMSKARRSAMLRRHDAGYWASEALHGFPQARHGFMAGWHAHKSAADEARLARDKARADHEENRASIREQAAMHRRRMAVALEQQWRTGEAGREATGRRQAREPRKQAGVVPLRLRFVPDLPEDPQSPADDGDWPAGVPHKRREHGDPGGNPPPSLAPSQDTPPATRGAPVADTTYDEVLRQARKLASATENDLQAIRQRKAELTRLADAMQGADVDPQSLSEMADMIDAHDAAEKSLASAHDRITAFPPAFASRHGLLNEAHQSAPVPAAERTFYEG